MIVVDTDQMTEESEGRRLCEDLHLSHGLALGARHGDINIETIKHHKQDIDTVHVHDQLLQSGER